MTTALTILFAVGVSKWAIAPVIIAAGISALSQLAGNYMSSKANEDAQAEREAYLARRKDEEQSWYDRNYLADPTQRADAQRAINMVSEELKKRSRSTAGRAAMGGATEEAVAQERANDSQAMADVIGTIAAEGEKRKEAVDAQHHANMQNLDDMQFNLQQQEAARKAQNMQAAMASAGSLAASIAGNSGDMGAGGEAPAAAAPAVGQPVDSGIKDSKTQLNKHKPANLGSDTYMG